MTDSAVVAPERPRLLDLCCKAGGAGMGYHRAGFEVVGVDIEPQPNYPFEFHLADALTFPLEGFAAVHASPPCQRWLGVPGALGDATYPDLLTPIRDRLIASGLPFVIENVPGAPLDGFVLCGSTFGLPVVRHRRFEVRPELGLVPSMCPPVKLEAGNRPRRRLPVRSRRLAAGVAQARPPGLVAVDDARGVPRRHPAGLHRMDRYAVARADRGRSVNEGWNRVTEAKGNALGTLKPPAPLEAMIACPACGSAVRDRCEHYVASVGHLTPPEDACDPYWRCTGESAAEVWARDGGRR